MDWWYAPRLPRTLNFQEDNMSIAQMLLPEFDQEMANTRKMLERVPDGKFDYKPHAKSMTLGRLAAHTCEIPSYASATLRFERMDFTGDEKQFSPTTRKEILDAFDKHVANLEKCFPKRRTKNS
jgi:hypothetical protein